MILDSETFVFCSVVLFSMIVLKFSKERVQRIEYNYSPDLYGFAIFETCYISTYCEVFVNISFCKPRVWRVWRVWSIKLTVLCVFAFSVLFCATSFYAYENEEIYILLTYFL